MTRLTGLKAKMMMFSSIILMVCIFALTFVSYQLSAASLISRAESSMRNVAEEGAKVIQARVSVTFDSIAAIANVKPLKEYDQNQELAMETLREEAERSGYLRMGLGDLQGNLLFTDGKTANLAGETNYKLALEGQNRIGGPSVSSVDSSIILAYFVPIKANGKVVGVLTASQDGTALSDTVSDISFGETGYAGMSDQTGATIAHPNKQYVLDKMNPLEQAKSDPEFQSLADLTAKMMAGESVTGSYTLEGKHKIMVSAAVPEYKWNLFISANEEEVVADADRLRTLLLLISAGFFVLGAVATYLLSSRVSTPLGQASKQLNIMATGDFTMELPQKLMKSKDETGELLRAMSKMQGSIRHILKQVKGESTDVHYMLTGINASMEKLKRDMGEIRGATQIISTDMEESAASTQEMNATLEEIEKSAESIATKAQDSATVVQGAYELAGSMREGSAAAYQETEELYLRAKFGLEQAMDESKAAHQVSELSETILQIAAQTNLLALNAAIEAARAGEAGRGFSVVSGEIRKLAESSKVTAQQIQGIAASVLAAVQKLSEHSGQVIDFIDRKVLVDYKNLVEASKVMNQHAGQMNDAVMDFGATSQELLASIQSMSAGVGEIAQAANHGADSSASIADKANSVDGLSGSIVQLAGEAASKSDLLTESVSHFRL